MRELLSYARQNNALGVSLFVWDFGGYLLLVAGAVLCPIWPVQILCSILAGVMMSNLVTLGHDAAHGSLTSSKRINTIIGTIAMAPGFFNYRMWIYDHHVRHHANTNGEHKDTYTPVSKAEFDAMPRWRQSMQRFYRQLNPLSFASYYIIERWSETKLFPRRGMPERYRPAAWGYLLWMLAFNGALAGVLLAVGHGSLAHVLSALGLGMLLPFLSFQAVTCFFLWTMHTHPRVAWFRGESATKASKEPELLTVYVAVPRWLGWLSHDVTCHPVHHMCPRIPCYRVFAAQQYLLTVMPDRIVSDRLTWRYASDTMRRCKLFDFQARRWMDFEGKYTSGPCSEGAAPLLDLKENVLRAA